MRGALRKILGSDVDDSATDGDRGSKSLFVILVDLVLVFGLLAQLCLVDSVWERLVDQLSALSSSSLVRPSFPFLSFSLLFLLFLRRLCLGSVRRRSQLTRG